MTEMYKLDVSYLIHHDFRNSSNNCFFFYFIGMVLNLVTILALAMWTQTTKLWTCFVGKTEKKRLHWKLMGS